jgi:hypothetical protein
MARPRTKTTVGAKPPLTELGTTGNLQGSIGGGVAAWSSFVDTKEYVPELIWPNSVRAGGILDQMRTDSQLAALFFGITMPIRRYKWMVDPNGADQSIVDALSADLNLDVVGEEPKPRGRSKNRFSFDNHLRKSMLALIYGHMFFEQVGYIGDAVNLPSDGLWHLRKLAERMPSTIQEINVAPDGGLVSIKQWGQNAKAIPVDNLIGYVWENDGGNWAGRSLFRECYKNWLIKDRLLRIDAINHERAGGIALPIAPDDASQDDIDALAQIAKNMRIGDDAGGALPPGTKWQMVRSTSGGVIESVRYHDEAMARRMLMMVAMLAQGSQHVGSYSLGSVFNDLFQLGQEAIAMWFRGITQDHLIEDYVDWNWGPEVEQVPLLVYQKDADERLPVADLVNLIDSGVLQADDELEATLRKRYNLPAAGAAPRIKAPTPTAPSTTADKTPPAPTSTSPPAKAAAEFGSGETASGDAPSPSSRPDTEVEDESERIRFVDHIFQFFAGKSSN